MKLNPEMVQPNKIGWYAIKHKNGWWVGTDKGVTCYAQRDLAAVALTIIWQREGGRELNYVVSLFTGADIDAGEQTPKYSAEEALERYEKQSQRQ